MAVLPIGVEEAETGTRPWVLRGTGWRGFHHHATLYIAAYAFLIAERARIPPSAAGEPPINSRRLAFPKIVNPEALPVRPERHVVNSIATIRQHLIIALAGTLARCPCCKAPRKTAGVHPFR